MKMMRPCLYLAKGLMALVLVAPVAAAVNKADNKNGVRPSSRKAEVLTENVARNKTSGAVKVAVGKNSLLGALTSGKAAELLGPFSVDKELLERLNDIGKMQVAIAVDVTLPNKKESEQIKDKIDELTDQCKEDPNKCSGQTDKHEVELKSNGTIIIQPKKEHYGIY